MKKLENTTFSNNGIYKDNTLIHSYIEMAGLQCSTTINSYLLLKFYDNRIQYRWHKILFASSKQ